MWLDRQTRLYTIIIIVCFISFVVCLLFVYTCTHLESRKLFYYFIVCLLFREKKTFLLYQDRCSMLMVLLRLAHLLGGSL